jgi:hypothetical protein
MSKQIVPNPKPINKQCQFLQNFQWSNVDAGTSKCASITESDPPLPCPPPSEFANHIARDTIIKNLHLFKIVCPINVDIFPRLLISHPNQPFVNSVCTRLQEGFWPWADTHFGDYPVTLDSSHRLPKMEAEHEFLHVQHDHKIMKGHYSPSFGTELLPGMYSPPIHIILKPHSDDLQLINDQSAGQFSLNSMILPSHIEGLKLDNITLLFDSILAFCRIPGNESVKLELFKSDIPSPAPS